MQKYIYNSAILKCILVFAFFFPLFSLGQSTLNPDGAWHDNNNRTWYQSGLGTAFCNYNGTVHVFNYQSNGVNNGGHTYMYTINQKHETANIQPMTDFKLGAGSDHNNKIEWHYDDEGSAYDEGRPLGRFFAFQFNGRLWCFQHIKSGAADGFSTKDESFECYAQIPLDTNQKCFTYYSAHTPVHTQLKMGAFQLDSMLYFVSKYSDGNKQWMIQEFSYGTDNHFHYIKNIMLPNISTNLTMLGGLVKRVDANGNEYMILNMYDEGNYSKVIGKLTPQIGTDGKRTFAWTSLFENSAILSTTTTATTLAEGTMKACRASESLPSSPDRLVFFGLNKDKCTDGYYKISFREFRFENDVMIAGTYGELNPPKSTAPSKGGDHYQVLATFELQPRHFSDAIEGVNGYQQYLWLFYPDGSKHFNGLMMQSDQWKLTSEPIVESPDLNDNIKYPGIDRLWSMVGMCDGAPPVSIDWEEWENPVNHIPGTPPTSLAFTVIQEHESEVTSTYEDQWSVGQEMEMSKHIKKLEGSLSEEFKYSMTYKNTISKGVSVKTTMKESFAMMEQNQDSGRVLYAVPTIRRYPYSAFPWWDANKTYPIVNSNQYLFRTMGIAVITKKKLLSEFPFEVEEPNDPSLNDWKPGSRVLMNSAILNTGLVPIITATWSTGDEGQIKTYEITNNSSESFEQTTEYEVNVSVGVEVPSVFAMSGSAGYKVSYSNESTVTNTFGTEIECDLSEMTTNDCGPNINALTVNVYWFRNSKNPSWWFYDSTGDQRPWYIAYFANNSKSRIALLKPGNKSIASHKDLFFAWTSESGRLHNYELIIANSPMIDNSSILYQKAVGNKKEFMPVGFKPEPGNQYYWVVRGMTEDDQIVWSEINTFVIDAAQPNEIPSILKAVVYPNPASSGNIQLVVDAPQEENLEVSLYEPGGRQVGRREYRDVVASPMTISLSGYQLASGVYFAVIRSGSEQVVKKVMIR